MTVWALFSLGKETLLSAGIADYETDARLLLEHAASVTRHELIAHGEKEISVEAEQEYRTLIKKRALHIPLQHLTGTQCFMGLTFRTDARALVPRFDTEVLVEEAMKRLFDGMRFLDLCTGSGCIAISLLNYSNDTFADATDVSFEALALAKENAKNLGVTGRFRAVQADLFPPFDFGRYDLIVSNPPYIPSAVIDTLDIEVRAHDPRQALDGGADGLCFYRRIAADAKAYMKRGAALLLEIGDTQRAAVSAILAEEGFRDITCIQDLSGRDRVVSAEYYDARVKSSGCNHACMNCRQSLGPART